VLSWEATNINFMVFGLTRPWFQPTIIMVRETPPYGHAPTYQISLTYLERQKSYGPDKLR
jgi:hypothetical protein